MEPEQGVVERAGSQSAFTRHWGRVLFFSTLAAVLVFFWWLLIYSGGVAAHHG